MLYIHTHHLLDLRYCQEAVLVIFLPDCFSTDVFQRFWDESLMLHTFSLQSARAVNGSNDAMMTASLCRWCGMWVSCGELFILCRDTLIQIAGLAERKRSIAFTPPPFSPGYLAPTCLVLPLRRKQMLHMPAHRGGRRVQWECLIFLFVRGLEMSWGSE